MIIYATMPESADEQKTPKRSRSRRKPQNAPVASVDLATKYLSGQLRRDVPGQWSADRLNQSQHDDGVTYVAINALMTAIRSSTVQINRKRKAIARDSEFNPVTKALPTPGGTSEKKDTVPFDNDKHALTRIMKRPNPTETINEILAQLVQQIMLTGSGLLWANPDQLGIPRELYVLPTALCQAQPPSPQYPYGYWRVTQYYPAGAFGMLPYPGSGGGVPVDARDVLRFKMPHPLWRWDALSPLTAGSVQLTILEAIDQARFSAMEGGLTTDAFILAPGLGQEQLNVLLEQMKVQNAGKRNHRKTVALGGEVGENTKFDVKFPHVSAKDMDYSAGWDQMVGYALALFGVPKAVANMAGTSSYAELYAALKQFHTLTLVPLAQWLSEWLTRHLCEDCFGPEFSIQIDVPAIDDKEMSERMVGTQLQNGLLTYNQALAHYNLPPVPGGDVIASIYVQQQTQKAMPQQAPPGAAPQPGAEAPPEQPQAEQVPAEDDAAQDDPLSALTGDAPSESLPDDGTPSEGDDGTDIQDAVGSAALRALGIDGDDEEDDSPIPQNRIAKSLTLTSSNGNGYHKALAPPTKPGNLASVKKRTHNEGEKWETNGRWYTIKQGRTVPTTAPGAENKPAPTKTPNHPDNFPGRGAKPAAPKSAATGSPSKVPHKQSPHTSNKLLDWETPVPDGHIRFYHGSVSNNPTNLNKVWTSTDREYARNYRGSNGKGTPVFYVDVPVSDPEVSRALDNAEWSTGERRLNETLELPQKYAKLMKPSSPPQNGSTKPAAPKPEGVASEPPIEAGNDLRQIGKVGSATVDNYYNAVVDAIKKTGEVMPQEKNTYVGNAWNFVKRHGLDKHPESAERFAAALKEATRADKDDPQSSQSLLNALNKHFSGISKPTTSAGNGVASEPAWDKAPSRPKPPPLPASYTAAVKTSPKPPPLPAPSVEAAAKSIPDSPAAKQTLASAPSWAASQADKHADRVAAHFGVSRAKAHAILVQAITAIADHKAKTGKTAGVAIKHNGKTVGIGPKKPKPAFPRSAPTQSAAPTLPRPANPDSRGSLPPKPAFPRHAKSLDGHSYGCVLFRVPPLIAAEALRLASLIDPADLAPDGVESSPHVTCLYGFTDDDPESVADILSGNGPIPLKFGKLSLFRNDEHDVLKVEVESLALRRLHSMLRSLPHESKYRDYVPHMTIAYLKPGTGDRYARQFGVFAIPNDMVSEAIFSDSDGEETPIPLAGTITKAAMSYLNDGSGGALVPPAGQTPLRKRKRKKLAAIIKDTLAELESKSWTPDDEHKHPRDHGKFSKKSDGGDATKNDTKTKEKSDSKSDADEPPEWDGTISQEDVEPDRGWHEKSVATWDFYDDGEKFEQELRLQSGEYTPPGHDEPVPVYRWVDTQDGDATEYGEWTTDEDDARSQAEDRAREQNQDPPDPEDSDIDDVSGQSWSQRERIATYESGNGETLSVRLDEGTFEFAGESHTCYRWTTRQDEDGEWTLDQRQAIRDGEAYAEDNNHEEEKVDPDAVWEDMFGSDGPSPLEICGALPGSTYKIATDTENEVEVSISHPKLEDCIRTFRKNRDGDVYVHNDLFIVKPEYQKEGLGATIFAAQAQACADAGVAWIECHAAGPPFNPNMNGFYTWPRFGYDMPLSEYKAETRANLERIFPDAKSVLDIMATPSVSLTPEEFAETKSKLDALARKLKKESQPRTEISGGDWWKVNGVQMLSAKFDLSPGSRSLAILEAYQKEIAKKKSSAGPVTKSLSPTSKTRPLIKSGPTSGKKPIRRVEKSTTPHREGEKWETNGQWYTIKQGKAVHTAGPGAAEPTSTPRTPAESSPASPSFTLEQLSTRKMVADIGVKLRDGEPVSPQEKQKFTAAVAQLPPDDHAKVAAVTKSSSPSWEAETAPTTEELQAAKLGAHLHSNVQIRHTPTGDWVVKGRNGKRAAVENEAVASSLARAAGLNVPQVHHAKLYNQDQAVVKKIDATPFTKMNEQQRRDALAKVPHSDLEQHALFDYLIGSSDPNNGNYLIGKDGELIAIDKEQSLRHGEIKDKAIYRVPFFLADAVPQGKAAGDFAFTPDALAQAIKTGESTAAKLKQSGRATDARGVERRTQVLRDLAKSGKSVSASQVNDAGHAYDKSQPPSSGILGKLKSLFGR